MACILSSMVDLIKNLCTNVGLVDRKQHEKNIMGFLMTYQRLTQQSPPTPPPSVLLGLANPVDSADGLELVSRVKDGLHQQNVGGFNDVQTIGARVERKQQDVDLFIIFERAQIFLEV